MLDQDVTEKPKTGTCAATFIVIGALAFPMILLGGLALGYGITTSLLIALALAAPAAVASAALLRVISRIFSTDD